MNKAYSIQLKATFLLIIFSLNMLAGFACSVGMDMGFNTTHHEKGVTKVHRHADGKEHHHKAIEHQHAQKGGKSDCCNDKVLKIAQADKAVPQPAKLLSPLFFTVFIVTYYNVAITNAPPVSAFNKHFIQGHHPPIPDIRIAIQSFQI